MLQTWKEEDPEEEVLVKMARTGLRRTTGLLMLKARLCLYWFWN